MHAASCHIAKLDDAPFAECISFIIKADDGSMLLSLCCRCPSLLHSFYSYK